MRPLGSGKDEMKRRENDAGDRWIVWKLPRTSPEQWAAGPREKGVMAELFPVPRRWVLHTSLEAAADYARKRTDELRARAEHHRELLPAFAAKQDAARRNAAQSPHQ